LTFAIVYVLEIHAHSFQSDNASVHRAAANDVDLTKPRGPRLRVQRFVLRC
jgi:hypothetical protein